MVSAQSISPPPPFPEQDDHAASTELAVELPSDWGSLVADLSAGVDRPTWRVHDRTHLEFAVDYRLDPAQRTTTKEWEAFFFIPESLRMNSKTYDKNDIHSDLQSYVRFAVPEVPFGDLPGAPLNALREAAANDSAIDLTQELRLFACLVRASGVQARRLISDALESKAPDSRSRGLAAAMRMAVDARRITSGLREVIATLPHDDEDLRIAAAWIDEDVSRLIETLFGSLALRLEKVDAPASVRQAIVDVAVGEARYRRTIGVEAQGPVAATKRAVERLEFRRHVLKRFTSSVLWLRPEVRDGTRIALEVLYALAAGVAMSFALVAALWNGNPTDGERLWMWAALAVLAYMGKDRIKARLQTVFSGIVSRHFPDRKWRIRDRERSVVLGEVDEQSGFVPFNAVPEKVLAKRRTTRKHPFEEQARPECVLWHRKVVRLSQARFQEADPRFDALTEIFRLDMRQWLAHTDDPKRKIVFADPDRHRVCEAVAPRVYNIGVVYRLRALGEETPWRRVRVVVTRKGIRRIERLP